MPVLWSGMDNALSVVEAENQAWIDGDPITNINALERPDEANYSHGVRVLNHYGHYETQLDAPMSIIYGGGVTMAGYPYIDTVNNYSGTADQFNLHWNDVIARDNTVSPGLYRKYWKNLHDKITGGAALRTCLMNLTDVDVADIDYRDIILIRENGASTYWTINKIIDYAPGGHQLTKVELVQWDKPPKLNAISENFAPKNNAWVGPPKNPTYENPIKGKSVYKAPSLKKQPKKNKSKNNVKTSLNKKGEIGFVLNNNSKNKTKGTGIALGHNVKATSEQTVLGKYNKPNNTDIVQIGGGYKSKISGEIVRSNAISVDRHGNVNFFGGEVAAEFTAGDVSIIGDVYFEDENGKPRKLYLKDSGSSETKSGY